MDIDEDYAEKVKRAARRRIVQQYEKETGALATEAFVDGKFVVAEVLPPVKKV